MADSFLDIKDILGTYSKQLDDELYNVAKEVAKTGVNTMKSVSPVNKKATSNKGRYKRGWRMQVEKGFGTVEATIYNATDYQLTHLLERPHVGKNQYGVWGTVHPKSEGHISKTQEEVSKEFEKEVVKRIQELGG